jgi:NAD+ kinase
MRPLVLSSKYKISIEVKSQHTAVQINCDGQRVHYFEPPVKIEIEKSNNPVRLVHTDDTNYFEILRNKLYWGIDVRSNPEKL